ncbi:MAG: hypothetical protein ACLR4A_02565 [Christensenellales bacterium]
MQRYPDNRPVGYQGMYPYQMPQQPIQIPVNPYMEPASQNRQLNLRGRSVASENDIRPNDIVMDGGVSFFPKDDGQAIFVKWWGSNGLIEGRVFVPAPDTTSDKVEGSNAEKKLDDILERLVRLEKRLGKPYNPNRSNHQNGSPKKEDVAHE